MNVAEAHTAIDALPTARALYKYLAHQLVDEVDADVDVSEASRQFGVVLTWQREHRVTFGVTLTWQKARSVTVAVAPAISDLVVTWDEGGPTARQSLVPRDLVSGFVDYLLDGWREWREYLTPAENAVTSDQTADILASLT